MNLDFDRLHKIYTEQGEEGLLIEKQKLLDEYLQTVPLEKRDQLKRFDKQIQYELNGLTPEQRIKTLGNMMIDNLFDLQDSMADLTYTLNTIKKDE